MLHILIVKFSDNSFDYSTITISRKFLPNCYWKTGFLGLWGLNFKVAKCCYYLLHHSLWKGGRMLGQNHPVMRTMVENNMLEQRVISELMVPTNLAHWWGSYKHANSPQS